MRVVTPEEALERILERIEPLDEEEKPLLEALDHILAEEVDSPLRLPPYDSSAMDGYAVHAADLGAPRELVVAGEVRAGHARTAEVRPGAAATIATGGVVPPGAAAVVPHEWTEPVGPDEASAPARIRILEPVPAGANIRLAGEDIQPGQRLLERGQLVGPSEIAVLAATGHAPARVVRRPLVSVLATGNEVVEPGEALAPEKVFNSNSYALGAQAIRAGALVRLRGIAHDTESELRRRLREALDADLVVTAGGVSSGTHGLVSRVLADEGVVETLAVRMKPGKPLAIGWLGGRGDRAGQTVPYIGLPGNPIAALVAFELFARPAILKLRGVAELERPTVGAVADNDLPNDSQRTAFFRIRLVPDGGAYRTASAGLQRSHALSSLLGANGLATVPHGGVRRGEQVSVRLIDWSGGATEEASR